MEQNPYQTPEANVELSVSGDQAQAEELRNQYLNHEASIRSIGLLYYLGTLALLISSAVLVLEFNSADPIMSLGMIALMGGLGAAYFWIGRGLRKLQSKVKIIATVFAAIGLIGFPLGTLINGYILYLLHSAKGKMVFSEEYHNVIEATPHIKYKTSIVIWLFIGIVVLGIGAAIVIPMVAK